MHLAKRFDVANQVAYLTGLQLLAGTSLWCELTEFEHFVDVARFEKTDLLALADDAVHEAYIGNRAAELVVMRVEYHRLQRRFGVAFRRWNAIDDGGQQFFDT